MPYDSIKRCERDGDDGDDDDADNGGDSSEKWLVSVASTCKPACHFDFIHNSHSLMALFFIFHGWFLFWPYCLALYLMRTNGIQIC